MGVACQQGRLTPPDTWHRSLFGTCICVNFKTSFCFQICRAFLDFHFEYPSVLSRFYLAKMHIMHLYFLPGEDGQGVPKKLVHESVLISRYHDVTPPGY